MENSSLRDALTDDQGGRLLDWGLARVKEAAERTAGMSDEEAEVLMDQQTQAVGAVMRQINRLVETAQRASQEEAASLWQEFVNALQSIEPPLPPARVARAASLALARHNQDSRALFDQLMNIIGEDESNQTGDSGQTAQADPTTNDQNAEAESQ